MFTASSFDKPIVLTKNQSTEGYNQVPLSLSLPIGVMQISRRKPFPTEYTVADKHLTDEKIFKSPHVSFRSTMSIILTARPLADTT